jgi:ABC-type lipoprotein release transport system permease subunit
MAWRNVWRNPRRTWLTVAAISFACIILIFMLSFQFGSYETMINSAIHINTGHIQIQAQDYFEERSMRQVVPDPGPILESVSGIDSVKAVTTRANAFSLVSSASRTAGAAVVGVDPEREARASTLETLVRQGRYLSEAPSGTHEAIVGRLLAEKLQIGLGEEIVLLGQGRDGSVAATALTVCGMYSSGVDELDRKTLFSRLDTFRECYAMRDAVHEVVIRLGDLDRVDSVVERIRRLLPRLPKTSELVVLSWDELSPGLTQAIRLDLTIGVIFWLLLVLVVAFSILNTFLMAVFERTREFGVMMSIGTSPGRLVKIMLLESSAMTLVGVSLGVVLGCILTWIFEMHGINLSGASEILKQYGISGRIHPELSLITALAGPILVWAVTFAVSLYPALKIYGLRPVEAMRWT